MERFAAADAGEGQIVLKLSKPLGREGLAMDEVPSAILQGYDCFGLYHHLDGSREWRSAKIVRKEALHDKHRSLVDHASTRFKYLLEFEHLRDYGQQLWASRNREDVLFSARWARDEANFASDCRSFVLDLYSESE